MHYAKPHTHTVCNQSTQRHEHWIDTTMFKAQRTMAFHCCLQVNCTGHQVDWRVKLNWKNICSSIDNKLLVPSQMINYTYKYLV